MGIITRNVLIVILDAPLSGDIFDTPNEE